MLFWLPLARGIRAAGTLALGALLVVLAALPAKAAAGSADYRIGPGDVLRVTVFQNPDLSLETRVSEGGQISYPLLGSVAVSGLPVSEVEASLARGLREGNFIKQPQVTVLVLQVRANQVSALGLVNRPGRYPIDVVGMRLSELLAQAGGIAVGGSDLVSLSGVRDGKPFRMEVDVQAMFGRQAKGEDPVLQNGDVLFVDRAPTVYIYGEVQRPGAMRLEREMTVMQALAAGGGLTLRGTERGLRVHRRNGDGKLDVFEPGMNERLLDGDVVYVRESLF